jgi:cytochrome b
MQQKPSVVSNPAGVSSPAVVAKPAIVRAWDLPTRVFHWVLVSLLAGAWASYEFAAVFGDNTLKWHRYNGYALLIAIVWRVLWGFVGSSTSRWSAFVRWPWTVARYALDLLRGRDRHYLGHNPLGTYMILGLLGAVTLQAVLGLMTVEHNDVTWGPLYKLVSEDTYKRIGYFHVRLFNYLIMPLVVFHIAANILYGLIRKDPLIRAMVTGSKPAGTFEDQSEVVLVANPLPRAALCLGIAAIIVLGGIVALGGKLIY